MKVENILSKLISYPSISETSNLDIINFISDYLNKLDISSKKIMHYLYLTRFKFTKITRKFSQVNLRYRIKRLLKL